MLTANQVQDTNIVELKVDGEVETKDIEAAKTEISSVLDESDKLRVLVVYEKPRKHGAEGDLGRCGT